MTKQTKATIEPGDIASIEITCSVCKSTISRPVDTFQNNLAACPSCGEGWMSYRQSLIYLSDLATRLRHLSSLPSQNPAASISIRFEVVPEREP